MVSQCSYDKIDENGHLHITTGKGDKKETRVIDCDNVILCAGQISKRDLETAAFDAGGDLASKVFTIGGAYEASELDAKRAIDMGTRLALKIIDDGVVPGNHIFSSRHWCRREDVQHNEERNGHEISQAFERHV
eukprot:scaffold90896_cov37-Cyclotella_meneghiniana.AAC.3